MSVFKKKFMATLVALGVVATSAHAQDAMSYVGPSVEVTASVGDVARDVQYGAAVGLNGLVAKNIVAGVDAGVENVFNNDRKIGVGARLGVVGHGTLFYGRVGYTNYRQALALVGGGKNYDGLQLGAGVERQVYGPVFIRGEYRYTNLSKIADTHTALAGVGVRF